MTVILARITLQIMFSIEILIIGCPWNNVFREYFLIVHRVTINTLNPS